MKMLRFLTPFLSSLFLTPSALADDSTCANPPIDSIFVVANSLRAPPSRDQVADDIMGLLADLNTVTADLTKAVAIDFMPDAGIAAYTARRESAKLVTVYVHDNQKPLIEDLCNASNLDSGCKDWPMEQTWFILLNQLAQQEPFAPQLVRVVHFIDGNYSHEEVHALMIDGQNVLQNENFSEAFNILVDQVLPEECDPGFVIGV